MSTPAPGSESATPAPEKKSSALDPTDTMLMALGFVVLMMIIVLAVGIKTWCDAKSRVQAKREHLNKADVELEDDEEDEEEEEEEMTTMDLSEHESVYSKRQAKREITSQERRHVDVTRPTTVPATSPNESVLVKEEGVVEPVSMFEPIVEPIIDDVSSYGEDDGDGDDADGEDDVGDTYDDYDMSGDKTKNTSSGPSNTLPYPPLSQESPPLSAKSAPVSTIGSLYHNDNASSSTSSTDTLEYLNENQ